MSDRQRKYIVINANSQEFKLYIKPEKEELTFSKDESNIEDLVKTISSVRPRLVTLMSTSQEIELLASLTLADIKVCFMSPEKLQELSNHLEIDVSHINLEKIAEFSDIIEPEIFDIKKIDKVKIKNLFVIYKDLQETIKSEEERLLDVEDAIKDNLQNHISWLKQREKESSEQIINILERYNKWEINSDVKVPLGNKEVIKNKTKERDFEQNSSTISVNKLPTKKVIRRYRGQVYEEEVIDYDTLKQLGLNKQKKPRKYRGQYIT